MQDDALFERAYRRHSEPLPQPVTTPTVQQLKEPLLPHASQLRHKRIAFPWSSPTPHAPSAQQRIQRYMSWARRRLDALSWLERASLLLPCLTWLRAYQREWLKWDIVAGASVAFMVVPQGMSYASMIGLPASYGLYGAFAPTLAYAVFGSSRELAVGPVSITSLLIATALKDLVPGSEHIEDPQHPRPDQVAIQAAYNHKAIQLSLLVACCYTAIGVLRLGFLTNFLSHSVVAGFTSGAAIIIGLSQVKHLLGFHVPRTDSVISLVTHYYRGIAAGEVKWCTLQLGLCLLVLMAVIKHYGKTRKRLSWLRPLGPITASALGLAAVVWWQLDTQHRVRVVGPISQGLPQLTVSWWWPIEGFSDIMPLAVEVMLLDLLESTSVARRLAARGRYEISANQEIIAMGVANLAGSAFNAYSTAGSFSRSAVNADGGCRTQLSGLVTALVVGVVLVFLTPWFASLPYCVIGAVVISGVSGLFEYTTAIHLFKVRKQDFAVWVTSFVGTLLLGVQLGLAIAIGLALLIVIYESAFPNVAVLGEIPGTDVWRSTQQYSQAQMQPAVLVVRVGAPIYFANQQYVREKIRRCKARAQAEERLQWLILDCSPIVHLDAEGVALIEDMHRELGEQGITLVLSNLSVAVADILERAGAVHIVGRDHVFVRVADAVRHCRARMGPAP